MDILLLGPVEVRSNGDPVALGGPKERALLALLALHPGATVSADELIDGLWGEAPPATAPKLVQQYVSHIRKALASAGGRDLIVTRGRGYELRVGRDQVDVGRFERLLAQGAARDALALWRGRPLADIDAEPFAVGEVRRLEEMRTVALELAIDQDLQAGRPRRARRDRGPAGPGAAARTAARAAHARAVPLGPASGGSRPTARRAPCSSSGSGSSRGPSSGECRRRSCVRTRRCTRPPTPNSRHARRR